WAGPAGGGGSGRGARLWLAEHLSTCGSCTARRASLAAQRDALREAIVRRAASADLSRIAGAVLARVADERPLAPVLRLQVWGTELWRERRGPVSAAAGLMVAASLAAVVLLSPLRGGTPQGTLPAAATRPP